MHYPYTYVRLLFYGHTQAKHIHTHMGLNAQNTRQPCAHMHLINEYLLGMSELRPAICQIHIQVVINSQLDKKTGDLSFYRYAEQCIL